MNIFRFSQLFLNWIVLRSVSENGVGHGIAESSLLCTNYFLFHNSKDNRIFTLFALKLFEPLVNHGFTRRTILPKGGAESVKRLLSTSKLSGSNPREGQTIFMNFFE